MVLMLSGCGMTGDLYLPEESPQDNTQTAVEPTVDEPAEAETLSN